MTVQRSSSGNLRQRLRLLRPFFQNIEHAAAHAVAKGLEDQVVEVIG